MKILRSWSSGLRIILEKIGKQIRKQKYKRHYKLLFNQFQKKNIYIYTYTESKNSKIYSACTGLPMCVVT